MKAKVSFLLMAAALQMSVSVNAQVASIRRSYIMGVPKNLTASGKPILYSRSEEGHSITIYDEDIQEEKRFTFENNEVDYQQWYEYATVMPTGAEVASYTTYESNVLERLGIDLTKVTSIEELSALLDSSGLAGEGYSIPFIDADGRFCVGYFNSLFGGLFFGRKYCKTYMTFIDGKEVLVEAQYKYTYPEENLVWEPENISYYSWKYYESPLECSFFDYDGSCPAEQELYTTQTLFNDDEKWEYVVPIYDQETRYDEPSVQSENETDGITLRRRVSNAPRVGKLNIVSEDGNVLYEILPPDGNTFDSYACSLFRMNGKLYLGYSTYEDLYVIYQIDTKSNSIKVVRTEKGEGRFASVSDGTIQMRLDDNEMGQDVQLSNMAGQIIGRNHIPAGEHSAQMNASGLSRGIYNLTLIQNGKVQKNQKIRVR